MNPNGISVGVDARVYIRILNNAQNNMGYFFKVSRGERPVIYILIYLFHKIFRISLKDAVNYVFIIINPLFVFSIYCLTLEISDDVGVSLWASLFAVSGYHIVVGMYSHFITNMLGLMFNFMSVALLLKSYKKNKISYFILSILFGILLIYTHPWTFGQYIFIMFVLLFINVLNMIFKFDVIDMRYIKYLLLYIVLLMSVDVIKYNWFYGYNSIIATKNALVEYAGSSGFWNKIIFTLNYLYGGNLSSFIILLLSIIGMWDLKNHNYSKYLITIIFVNSFMLFIGNDILISRIYYNIPFEVYAAFGCNYIINKIETKTLKTAFSIFIILYQIEYLFRSVVNLI